VKSKADLLAVVCAFGPGSGMLHTPDSDGDQSDDY
jgi:hypothetical protein